MKVTLQVLLKRDYDGLNRGTVTGVNIVDIRLNPFIYYYFGCCCDRRFQMCLFVETSEFGLQLLSFPS